MYIDMERERENKKGIEGDTIATSSMATAMLRRRLVVAIPVINQTKPGTLFLTGVVLAPCVSEVGCAVSALGSLSASFQDCRARSRASLLHAGIALESNTRGFDFTTVLKTYCMFLAGPR